MRAKEKFPRKQYSPEFKMELVRMALEEEGSVAALARQHDVNDNLLFKWIRLWQREGRVSELLPWASHCQLNNTFPSIRFTLYAYF
ncbi:transposase [Dickeya oryzae]|uniref:transposase n=1 Tax=Dickeya oryzae TaxID=1240404 RepID=UPI002096D26D|nr:transposase [Dickeya oryzae]MCO7253893.1 transposase [Dickeya oryzae]